MANNPERDCSTCKYGDNGSNPEGCPETCLEPELPDYDPNPIPPKHSREEELERQVQDLQHDNQRLRSTLALAKQRLLFALDTFHPRPPFRIAPEPRNAPFPPKTKKKLPPNTKKLSR